MKSRPRRVAESFCRKLKDHHLYEKLEWLLWGKFASSLISRDWFSFLSFNLMIIFCGKEMELLWGSYPTWLKPGLPAPLCSTAWALWSKDCCYLTANRSSNLERCSLTDAVVIRVWVSRFLKSGTYNGVMVILTLLLPWDAYFKLPNTSSSLLRFMNDGSGCDTLFKPLIFVDPVLGLVPSRPERFAWNLCIGRFSVVRRECEVAVVASDPTLAKFHGSDLNRTAVAGFSPVETDLFYSACYLVMGW